MLRKRSRAVTNTQTIVGDHSNNPWLSPEKSTKPTSFFFNSPKFFKGLFTNYSSSTLNEQKPMMSPTSILESKAFCAFANTFWVFDNKKKNPKTFSSSSSSSSSSSTSKHSWEQPNNSKGIGLALIDETNNTEPNNTTPTSSTTKQQQKTKLVVFGSQLKIQAPPLPQSSAFHCFSPREFGIKTPRNNLWPFGNKDSQVHPQEFSHIENGLINSGKGNQNLSLSDMELSEDYTCVIHNGPNPKTTHIFGNCIVQSCCGVVGSSSFSDERNGDLSNFRNTIPLHQNFLSYCHNCKKKLGEGSDIYMYRGEKAFCSPECRCQEMLLDDVEN